MYVIKKMDWGGGVNMETGICCKEQVEKAT